MPRGGHQIHGKKPVRKRRAGFLERRTDARVNVMTAMLTGVSPALGDAVKFGIRATTGTRTLTDTMVRFYQTSRFHTGWTHTGHHAQ